MNEARVRRLKEREEGERGRKRRRRRLAGWVSVLLYYEEVLPYYTHHQ